MGTLERIVRPVLPASIRPAALPQPTDGTQADNGVTISGLGGKLVALSHSASSAWQKSPERATYRLYDVVRVYRSGNHNQYVDVQVTTFMRFKDALGIIHDRHFYHPQEGDDQHIIARDQRADITS